MSNQKVAITADHTGTNRPDAGTYRDRVHANCKVLLQRLLDTPKGNLNWSDWERLEAALVEAVNEIY